MNENTSLPKQECELRIYQLDLVKEISKHILSYPDYVNINNLIESMLNQYKTKLKEKEDNND